MTLIDNLDSNRFFNLDTIGFGRLVENARGQIPRFAPEWTDHNLHDPGMTIIDLLAWVVDQQIYRLGFISDRHLKAFAALVGQRAIGATPATGLVWPNPPSSAVAGEPRSHFFVHAGTALQPVTQTDISFVLDRDVMLSGATLENTVGDDVSLVLSFDRPLAAELGGPVSIGFDIAPLPGAAVDQQQTESVWGPLVFEYRLTDGDGNGDWDPVAVVADDTLALTRTGTVQVAVPPASDLTQGSELRLRLDQGFFPVDPSFRRVALNVLPVTQQVERLESLSAGTGRPDHRVVFDREGVVSGLQIQVDGEPWEERADFCQSGPDDPHYVLRANGAVFGNGVNGRRPPDGVPIDLGPVIRTAGEAGNIRADVSWSLTSDVGGDLQFSGRNCAPFTGGTAAPTVSDLLAAARDTATDRQNSLTDADLIAAALRLPGFAVMRAEVLAGYDPAVPDRFVNGTRSLVVFPYRAEGDEAAPVPSQYLRAVDDALNEHRVLGERRLILAPQVVVVDMAIAIVVTPGNRPEDAAASVRAALRRRLSAFNRTADRDGSPWTLGRPVAVEDIKAIAAEVAGVMFVPDCRIGRPGLPMEAEPVTVDRHGIVVAGHLDVVARTATPGEGGKRS